MTRPKRLSVSTPVIIVLVVVAALAAYLAVTRFTDRSAPGEAEVAAAFVPVAGLAYSELPPDTMSALETAFTQQAGPDAVAHLAARQLSQGGRPVAVVFILAIDPDEMEGDFETEYVSGFTTTSQATLDDFQVGDTTGHIGKTPLGTVAFFFDADGFAFNIVGRDDRTVRGIAQALEAGNS